MTKEVFAPGDYRIVATEQGGQTRAGYGQALIARLADDLTRRFGRGFGKANPEPETVGCAVWWCRRLETRAQSSRNWGWCRQQKR